MNLDLTGKIALVTGSTAGIGLGIAKQLAAQGAIVVVNGRTRERVDAAVQEVAKHGPPGSPPGSGPGSGPGSVFGVAADVGTAEGVTTLIEGARDKAGGPIDVLVINAGVFGPQPFEEVSDEDWERFYRVNVLSGVRASRAVMGGMKQRGWGRIVFISSESAMNIPTEMIHYGVTKTAQLGLARGLAKSLSGTGVTVNSVLPGPTWSEGVSEMTRQMAKDDDDIARDRDAFVRKHRPSSIIQRFAEVEEIASMVGYVCSPAASATTGAALRCEGGIVDVPF